MRKVKKPVFFIVFAVIALFTLTTIFGVHTQFGDVVKTYVHGVDDIRLGIDIQGGVDVTFEPAGDVDATEEQMDAALETIKLRLANQNISDSETYLDYKSNRIIVRFPWQAGEKDFNPEQAVKELGETAELTFRKGTDTTTDENGDTVPSGDIVLTGADVAQASTGGSKDDTTGDITWVVTLDLNDSGTEKFYEATSELYQSKGQISIWMDNTMVSAPSVNAVISDGKASISGNFTYESAKELADKINSGALPFSLETTSFKTISPTMGEGALTAMMIAGVITLALIVIYMIALYRLLGVVASITLIGQVAGMLAAVSGWFGFMSSTTLTIPGIAGIILGIGMAVDANVIIFARVKEELTAGKSVHAALKSGFHKAMSAIIDGNVTTLIAAGVLWLRGSGTVKGFAQTLALGIVVSMFTALVITRLIIFSFYGAGIRNEKVYGRHLKERKPFDFLGKKKIFFVLSIILCLCGPVMMGVNHARGIGAMNYSLDFVGGTSTNVTFDKDYSIKEIDSKIVPVVEDVTGDHNVQAQKVKDSNQIIIKTQTLNLDEREALNNALADKFGVDTSTITAENISSTVSSEMRQDAIIAVIISAICMLIYIWFRFKDVRFASSAVLALLHDLLFVLTFYALARTSVGNTFIACMLTILGYSINATIVIFDRIREELRVMKRNDDLKALVNRSITYTLTRSIYTTFTTFVMVAVLYIMGVSSIKEFAAPLMVGIAGGGYSSVCITGALWYVMKTKIGGKKAAKKK